MDCSFFIKPFCFIGAFIFCLSVFSQHGHIQGVLIDDNGINISGATIVITDLQKGTSSDLKGKFFFLNVPIGEHQLTIDYLGYTSIETSIVVVEGATNILTFTLTPESIILNNVILTAYRNDGQTRALNTQKNKTNITNIISVDQTGKFPDANIGDALKRVPGITMQIDQGEARDIIIRGLAPELNSVMINGSRIPSAEGDNRNIQMDLIPSDMIQLIEVNKTLTPDKDADALGGVINLITRTSPEGFRVSSTLGIGLNTIANKRLLNGSFLIGNRSKNNALGFMVSALINDNDFGSHNIEAEWKNTFEFNSGNLDDDGEAIVEEVDVNPYPNVLGQQTHFIQRVRRSFAANFDYKFNNNHDIFLKTMYNWRDDRENRYVFEYEVPAGETIEANDFTISNGNLISFPVEVSRQTKGGINTNRSKNARLEDQRMQNYSLGGNHFFNKAKFDWLASFAKASEERQHERVAEYKSVFTVTNTTTDSRFPFFSPENPSDKDDLDHFLYDEIIEENKFTKEEDVNFFGNIEFPLQIFKNRAGSLKFGIKNRHKFKIRRNDFEMFDLESDYPTLADVPVRNYSVSNYLAGSQYQAGEFADMEWLGNLTLTDGEPVVEEFLRQQMSIKEKVFSSYIMTNQQLSKTLSFVTGIRVEHTRIKAKANQIEDSESIAERFTSKQSYTNILPSLHLKYKHSDQTIIRFAWTNTIARPNYVDLVPTQDIIFNDKEIVLGNPSLDATTSMNFDVMTEHYFKSIGLISTGIFYKSIKGFIYTFKSETTDDTFGTETSGFDLFMPLNGESASLFGLEFAFQRRLNFLPSFGKNFSLNVNYTYLSSRTNGIRNTEGDERKDLNLPNTAAHTFNLALGYDSKKISSRFALNFADDYLDDIGRNAFEDIYYDNQLFLDFNFNYALSKQLNFYVAVNNISNQPLRLYQGRKERTAQDEYYDRRISFGIKYDFFKRRQP